MVWKIQTKDSHLINLQSQGNASFQWGILEISCITHPSY